MQVRLGDLFAECPYCSSTEFLAPQEADEDARQLVCATCGGYASRVVVLENLAEKAGELGSLMLARLKEERRLKRSKR